MQLYKGGRHIPWDTSHCVIVTSGLIFSDIHLQQGALKELFWDPGVCGNDIDVRARDGVVTELLGIVWRKGGSAGFPVVLSLRWSWLCVLPTKTSSDGDIVFAAGNAGT